MYNYLDGFERKEVTIGATQSVVKGKTVKFINSFRVNTSSDGQIFDGVCTHVEGYNASVQLKGYVRVGFTGTAPDCGYVKLVANNSGGVKVSDSGRYVLVTDVDDENGICGIIL